MRSAQLVLLMLLVQILVSAPPARADLIQVPQDVSSIQAAIDGASDGDVIQLAPGSYEATLTLRGGITLVGGGLRPEDTVITGSYINKLLTIAGDSRPLRIENLTLRDGFSVKGGALDIQGADVTLYRLRFLANSAAQEGGAIYATSSHLTVRECLFFQNYAAGGDGGAVYIYGDDGTGRTQIVENCTWAGNAGCCGGVSLVLGDCRADVANNILEDVNCLESAEATLTCNNGSVCGTDGGHNFIADPQYCGFENVDCRLESSSPCLPENNPDCGLIGAYGSCASTATDAISFSALKALY